MGVHYVFQIYSTVERVTFFLSLVSNFIKTSSFNIIIENWRIDYNAVRPHSSLNNLAPDEFKKKWRFLQVLTPVKVAEQELTKT
ncbi:integrase core domain-containing protein [bacterium]|nr:integrase core domain-containing protein [bacterium]